MSRSFTGVRWRVINLDTQDRTGGQDMEGHVGKERKGEEKEKKGKKRKGKERKGDERKRNGRK